MADSEGNRAAILSAAEAVIQCDPSDWSFAIVEGSRDQVNTEPQTYFVQWARSDEGLDFEAGDPAYAGDAPHSPAVIERLRQLGLDPTDINFRRVMQFADTDEASRKQVARETADLAYEILFEVFGIGPDSELDIQVEIA